VLPDLPILAVTTELIRALDEAGSAVLEAPPGAGKSTVVPLLLLDEPWLAGRKILMLEPRRLAARAVATRLAATLGEAPGGRVGYRMRLESRISKATRIEVVTEGILARRLETDPALEDVGCVIFDEFHERSVTADLGLALCLDARQNLRSDLRILVMSATLDGAAVAALLGNAPRVTSAGRQYPVHIVHARRPVEHVEREVAATIQRALQEESGDALVFLPGAAEIHRVARTLEATGVPTGTRIMPLMGELAPDAQDAALKPSSPGTRKVVLSTSIAETSLTIEGVRIVVDSGLARRSRFDAGSGMSRLETLPVSLAAAEQRRGRAGRLEPGVCYRVYTEADERRLPLATPPEILEADLASLALDLALWGTDVNDLRFLDPPPAAHLVQARDLLVALGALDIRGRTTPLAAPMGSMGLHPRLARMLLGAGRGESARVASRLAAILSERDFARSRPGERNASLEARLDLLDGRAVTGLEVDRGAITRVRRLAGLFEREAGGGDSDADVGLLLSQAYPDRIGRRRADSARYVLANGRGAAFSGPDSLSTHEFIVVADLDGGEREARIHLAAGIRREDLYARLAAQISIHERVEWDPRQQIVLARRERRYLDLILDESNIAKPDPDRAIPAMIEGIRSMGIECLPLPRSADGMLTRVEFLRRVLPADQAAEWPDCSDAGLLANLEDWLAPYLQGIVRRDHLSRLDMQAILAARLDFARTRELDRLAPTHLVVPSGSRIPIDYASDPPRVAVRLQEVFGLAETPRVAGGRVALALELLSPARRPVQLTADLESFWTRGYIEVRKELKGRYPKHYWPDDPRTATATARVKPRN
jgi:ATP-dependent helicase HrpB